MRKLKIAWIACAIALSAACGRREDTALQVAAVSATLGATQVEAGAPMDVHYTFTVATGAAPLPADQWVFVHVLDDRNELLWTDDHAPMPPTQSWKPGNPVTYTRTMVVPRATPSGDLRVEVGVFSRSSGERLRLAARDRGMRSYEVATFRVEPTRNPVIAGDGWYDAEAGEGPGHEWRWSRKDSHLSFQNPRTPVTFYLWIDQPVSALGASQAVEVRGPAGSVGTFMMSPGPVRLERLMLTPDQLGTGETVDLTLSVNPTFVPAAIPQLKSGDTRDLGIRLFGAFVEATGSRAP